MKRCVDCKHCIRDERYSMPVCGKHPMVDPVTGESTHKFCEVVRSFDIACGPGAKHFEPKEQPTAGEAYLDALNKGIQLAAVHMPDRTVYKAGDAAIAVEHGDE